MIKTLLVSRKFWLTLIPMISSTVLYAVGKIDANQLADALTAGFGLLVLAISHEDHGSNSATVQAPATSKVVVTPGPEATTKGNGALE